MRRSATCALAGIGARAVRASATRSGSSPGSSSCCPRWRSPASASSGRSSRSRTAYQRRSPTRDAGPGRQRLRTCCSACRRPSRSQPAQRSSALIDYRIEIVVMFVGVVVSPRICSPAGTSDRRSTQRCRLTPAAAREPRLRPAAERADALDDRLDVDADRVPAARARADALAGEGRHRRLREHPARTRSSASSPASRPTGGTASA